MKEIETNWQDLVGATSSEQEVKSIARITKQIADLEGSSFQLFITDTEGQIYSYNDFQLYKKVESVQMEIIDQEKTLVLKGWHPIDVDNIFLFFLE